MKITRVLNNNVLLGEEDNITYLLMGLSIGYKRKAGDVISSGLIEKMFVLTNPQSATRLKEMISFIPEEYFNFCTDAVQFIKSKLKNGYTDNLYIMLTDHFYNSVERCKQGKYIENALLSETKRFYKEEFAIAKEVVEMANQRFGVDLKEEEAGFITFHIINSQINNDSSSIQEMTRLIQEVLTVVKNKYHIEFKEDKTSYSRFITHLKYFAEKIFTKKDDSYVDEEIYELVKTKYPDEFSGAKDIINLVEKKYNYKASNMDAMYLTLHISRIINE